MGSTALMRAAWEGHRDVVNFLLGQAKADVTVRTHSNRTAFMAVSKRSFSG